MILKEQIEPLKYAKDALEKALSRDPVSIWDPDYLIVREMFIKLHGMIALTEDWYANFDKQGEQKCQ